MKEILNLVASLTFHNLDQVTSYLAGSTGKVYLQTSGHSDIQFVKGALSFNCVSSSSSGGTIWTSTLSGNLKSIPADLSQGILILELESGEIVVVGEPELPVTLNITESLTQKSLQISHKSWHKPLILAV